MGLGVILGVILLGVGCEKQQPVAVPQVAPESEMVTVQGGENRVEKLRQARVVGYRFTLPGEEDSSLPRESGFSLLSYEGGQLDWGLLQDLKVEQATLTERQRAHLVAAVYEEDERMSPAACYDPHHIFLFYDEEDALINVVEVCFSCVNLHTFPERAEAQYAHHDFRTLARLCGELGLMREESVGQFIRLWDGRAAL